jgi:hypothetical protein
MKTQFKINLMILLFAGLALCLGFVGAGQAQPSPGLGNNPRPSASNPSPRKTFDKGSPVYAKGRFIVKFKSEGTQALEDDAEILLEKKKEFRQALRDKSPSLDKLNMRHKVSKARSLFMKRRGITTAAAKQWQQERMEKVKTKFKLRAQRAKKLKNSLQPPGLQAQQKENTGSSDLTNFYVLEVPQDSNIEEIVKQYQADPHVEYAQPDYIAEINSAPNDPYYPLSLWGLEQIQVAPAWNISQGEGIVVAVVDTGVDYEHFDIKDNI